MRRDLIACDVDRSCPATTVRLSGDLVLSTVATVRRTVLKCATECPDGVVIDLSAAVIGDEISLMVFGALSRRLADWPTTPLLLCSDLPEQRALLRRACKPWGIPVHDSLAAAHAAVPSWTYALQARRLLRPARSAVADARALIGGTCQKWGIPHLLMATELIAAEFVANAVEHAGTDLELILTLRDPYLHVAVADGNPAPPRVAGGVPPADRRRGRGLELVKEFAEATGCLQIGAGKVVWATLSTDSSRDW